MALYLVLGILFLTILLAQVLFSTVLSHASLTRHQVSRAQAFYAAKLGMVYAIDRLSNGTDANWTAANYTRYICRGTGAPCAGPNVYTLEPDLPASIRYIIINVTSLSGSDVKIDSTVNYTYIDSP